MKIKKARPLNSHSCSFIMYMLNIKLQVTINDTDYLLSLNDNNGTYVLTYKNKLLFESSKENDLILQAIFHQDANGLKLLG